MPDPTDSPDSWSKVPLAWERASGALFLSRQRGWVWRGVPAGTAVPERLVGHHTTGTHQDVVSIDLTDEKMPTSGARFAPGDWGRRGAPPVRGPVDGAPDEVLMEVLDWPERG